MIRQTDWLNLNRYRAYPFSEDSRLDAGSLVSFENSVLLDFQLVSYTLAPRAVRLTQIEITNTPDTAIFTFEYVGGGTFTLTVPVTASFPYAAKITSSAHYIQAIFGRGIVDLINDNAVGTYTLTYTPNIEPALTAFQPLHRVESIQAVEATPDDVLTGTIHLEEGYNCRIEVNSDFDRVTINGRLGAGAGQDCTGPQDECLDSLLCINGLHAGGYGDFLLQGHNGVDVIPEPENNRVIIRAQESMVNMVCDLCARLCEPRETEDCC